MSLDVALGPGEEFDLVAEIVQRVGARARGIGDDAAVIAMPRGARLVASVDAAIEGVHFRREWLTPREIGWRSAAAALSDLAAMAATPLGVLLALALPDAWREAVPELAAGLAEALDTADAALLGGNTARADTLSLTTTVMGHAFAPVGRDGALPGDLVYVTGRLGGPAAAVAALAAGDAPAAEHRARFARPVPRLRESRWLADAGAHAAIDVSDGLAADLAHIAAASGVRVRLDLERVPCVSGVDPRAAAAAGEEYELALCAPGTIDVDAFVGRFGLELTEVGRVDSVGAGGAGLDVSWHGERVAPPRGHDHLSR